MTGYGLNDWCLIQIGIRDISVLPRVQPGSGSHPATYPIGIGKGTSPVIKRPGRESDRQLNLVPR